MIRKISEFLLIWHSFSAGVFAQNTVFTRQDSLRGFTEAGINKVSPGQL